MRHLFLMTGALPNTDWVNGCVVLDDKGFVKWVLICAPTSCARRPGLCGALPRGDAPGVRRRRRPLRQREARGLCGGGGLGLCSTHSPGAGRAVNPEQARFARIRRETEALVQGLTPEDCLVQAMPDVSPTKWHLAHTSLVLRDVRARARVPGTGRPTGSTSSSSTRIIRRSDPRRWPERRGTWPAGLTGFHPTGSRSMGDAAIARGARDDARREELGLGIQHEQQHQELIVTDVKHNLRRQPAPTRLPGASRRTRPGGCCGPGAEFRRSRGRCTGSATLAAEFTYDNESASAHGLSRALRAGLAAGDQRRVPGVHRDGEATRPAGALAVRRAGTPAVGTAGEPALLGKARRRVDVSPEFRQR